MSEYQYYEFVAVDRPLAGSQVEELRALSSRAQITSTRFVNTYAFGNFHGDFRQLMEGYFDAHLYLANWGTRRLMLRLPRGLLDVATAGEYCSGESAVAWATARHVIVDLTSEDEDGDWEDDGEGWLASIIPVRADLAAGDLRVLYLGWLLCAQSGELDEQDVEPPVPPNLGTLTAALQSLVDFLRIDEDLLATAAAASSNSPLAGTGADEKLADWIVGLPMTEKDMLLLRAVRGDGALLGKSVV